jgi:glycosyltransferase involved in cell wall biosynthesis
VDNQSTDETREWASEFRNTRVVTHHHFHHADTWAFAIEKTDIRTPWVLRLDADYIVPRTVLAEIAALEPHPNVGAYKAHFDYCIYGRPLRASLYPPNTVLFRRDRTTVRKDGHAERWDVDGEVRFLRNRLQHDDRKTMNRWIDNQRLYHELEAAKLASEPRPANWKERVRRWRWVAPVAVGLDLSLRRGLVLDGKAGLMYTFQRVCSELMLSLYLLEHDLSTTAEQGAPGTVGGAGDGRPTPDIGTVELEAHE